MAEEYDIVCPLFPPASVARVRVHSGYAFGYVRPAIGWALLAARGPAQSMLAVRSALNVSVCNPLFASYG